MALEFSFFSIFQLLGAISPILLGFLLVAGSIFNNNIKGFIYLGGVLVASMINILIGRAIGRRYDGSDPTTSASPEIKQCQIFNNPLNPNDYTTPAYNSFFIAFTLAYLLLPMIYNKEMNYYLFSFILFLFLVDAVTKIMKKCNDLIDITVGAFVGFILGTLQFVAIHYSGNDSLLFFNDFVSNNTVCSRPQKQTFKCAVYKNGELIKNL